MNTCRRFGKLVVIVGLSLSFVASARVVFAEEEAGFQRLTDKNYREHWLGYGLQDERNTWPANWEYSESALHAKCSWRMANTCTCINIIGSDNGTDKFLHQIIFFVGAAG